MWFKQLQLFELTKFSLSPEKFEEQLAPLAFTSCLPSLPSASGWIAPVDEEGARLVQSINGYSMICLQIEEKILPASVVRQELMEKVKFIEMKEARKVRQKEKLALKDEIILTLLPRAFSKFTKVFAFIDTKNHWLILNTTHAGKTEQFLNLFKRCAGDCVRSKEVPKLSFLMTGWLKDQKYPKDFSIEKACLLQDPQQQKRVIRCQQQNLFASSIQQLIKEGCEAKHLALCWQDRVNFTLADDFTVRNIQYQEEILSQSKDMESETALQLFSADFFIMSATLTQLLQDLIDWVVPAQAPKEKLTAVVA